ncbi:parallel beta-helix domain-containing protein [Atopomonas sediminilitoris]|uniref:parallel beta-helix domain-containing protein n=1 Tax=Atopomonas sediminilitoris TaxID=2919919 RepID=UPI001F4E795C|nr:parallel beta-helix domain-containing protein [Atopomonas sediminilitoris]MCJ8170219.1 right-handed parallel beta-helix repeat-containing protein [Atopomonas sediminilitoris]
MPRLLFCAAPLAALLLAGCGEDAPQTHADFQKDLQTQLIRAKPGAVIEVPEGTFQLDRSLTLTVDGVTLRGAGMDKSVLSFKGQKSGAEGLTVSASDFTLENLAIEDSKGDGVKITGGKNIVIRGVRVEWTNGPDTKNGSYGLYPVQTENTLIEDSVVYAASDAGIYVGQSRNVVVRNNRAERNVAGIEIENTIGADVYGNLATDNTGGILVFNMPNLPQPGHTTRVFNNKVVANNHDNFAPKGTVVASVPAGSGVLINSNDRVEIFDNDIADNQTANVIISSYFSAGYDSQGKQADNFDPYPESIYIHGNRFSGGGDSPDHLELKALRIAEFGLNGRLPDVLWDGIVDPAKLENGQLPAALRLCLDNGAAGLVNVDAGNGFKQISTDTSAHQCTLTPLPAIALPFVADEASAAAQEQG